MDSTNRLLKILFNAAVWVFVPAILVIILYYTRHVISKADDKKHRNALRASFWAGIILFGMALIYQVGTFTDTGFPSNPIYQGFDIEFAIGGGVVSFFLFLIGKRIASREIGGIALLLAVFVSCYALVHYLFIRTWNDVILSLTLGVTFGYLAQYTVSASSKKPRIHEEGTE